jgi:signal transduction histidine kinase
MIPHLWRLSISLARTALSLSFLVIYFYSVQNLLSIPGAIFLSYFAYSLVTMWRRPILTQEYSLGAVGVDGFVSLTWVAIYSGAFRSPDLWFWVSVASWLFVLAHAAITQKVWVAAALTAMGLILLFLIPSAVSTNLTAVVLGGGVLSAVWGWQKSFFEERLSLLAKQGVLLRNDAQKARESERQRIAADFHDGPLQSFIAFQMRLELLRRLMERDADTALEELRQLQDISKTQVNELRAFVRSMRPAEVEGTTLAASLSRLVEQFQKDTGINATFVSGDFEEPPDTETALELLQIVREALNNVQKHSRATRVLVSIARNQDALEISVDDNGGGFPFSGTYSLDELDLMRMGPVSIKRRVRSLNAELQVDSRPGEGSGLKVRVGA